MFRENLKHIRNYEHKQARSNFQAYLIYINSPPIQEFHITKSNIINDLCLFVVKSWGAKTLEIFNFGGKSSASAASRERN